MAPLVSEQELTSVFPEQWEREEAVTLAADAGATANSVSVTKPVGVDRDKDEDEGGPARLPGSLFPQFLSFPLEGSRQHRICPKCSRPFLVEFAQEHAEECNDNKPPKPADVSSSELTSSVKEVVSTAVHSSSDNSASVEDAVVNVKRRKTDSNTRDKDSKESRKPSKAAAAATSSSANPSNSSTTTKASSKRKGAVKVRAPVDVEKQCGVLLPNGQMCARSLTCKTHSMGSKRAVPGRSQPYDVLLAAYQKKNYARIQRQRLENAKSVQNEDENEGPVDSDHEADLVMNACAQSGRVPLEHRVVIPVRRRHSYFRARELVAAAFRHDERNMQVTGTILGRVIPFSVL
ncbi:SAGA complex subunit Sgf73 [Schizosaccharomyces japonicus yFS275]|uniref:SAGA complex subunit Sgf73 n=1 Tax=Schizosaccharomyces japonicus (strain yFS275 / FY16936) TaxID=402676 RepID=B6JUY8_SCHJY|nr:SAGA complex subunit Sgf73 [Schizosaccharomyces japonicus yFS275]EEB05092.1 SAGA complex subunit Sgf73 [Schizosaccharomyces japonicus yFS275]